MMSTSIPKRFCAACAAVLSLCAYSFASDRTFLPKPDRMFNEIEQLVRRHYPKAILHRDENKMSFAFNTRTFILNVPLKTGEWQEAREMKGPKMGGVMGTVEVREGRYEGAAFLPQTFEHWYFSDMVSTVYSEVCNHHVYCHLWVPKIAKKDAFIKDFNVLLNSRQTIEGLCD